MDGLITLNFGEITARWMQIGAKLSTVFQSVSKIVSNASGRVLADLKTWRINGIYHYGLDSFACHCSVDALAIEWNAPGLPVSHTSGLKSVPYVMSFLSPVRC